jgi:hypothetical protein
VVIEQGTPFVMAAYPVPTILCIVVGRHSILLPQEASDRRVGGDELEKGALHFPRSVKTPLFSHQPAAHILMAAALCGYSKANEERSGGPFQGRTVVKHRATVHRRARLGA